MTTVNIGSLIRLINHRLDERNYLWWSFQFRTLLEAHDLFSYYDGSISIPTIFVISETNGVQPTLEYQQWVQTDKALLNLLVATLSDDVVDCVFGCQTSSEAWQRLKKRFAVFPLPWWLDEPIAHEKPVEISCAASMSSSSDEESAISENELVPDDLVETIMDEEVDEFPSNAKHNTSPNELLWNELSSAACTSPGIDCSADLESLGSSIVVVPSVCVAPECTAQIAHHLFDEVPSLDEGLHSVNDLSCHLPISDKGGGCTDLGINLKGLGHLRCSNLQMISKDEEFIQLSSESRKSFAIDQTTVLDKVETKRGEPYLLKYSRTKLLDLYRKANKRSYQTGGAPNNLERSSYERQMLHQQPKVPLGKARPPPKPNEKIIQPSSEAWKSFGIDRSADQLKVMEDIAVIFHKADKDNSGTLTVEEFEPMMSVKGILKWSYI